MMNTATPIKQVKSCIACSKSTLGHVRLMKNIAMKSIFEDILAVLDVSFSENLDNIYICESCLSVIAKTKELRQKCKENVNNISLHQNRQKRVIIHSVSPKVKRTTCTSLSTRRKKLFSESCTGTKENVKECELTSEHNYSLAGQPKLNMQELYIKHHPMSKYSRSTKGVLGDSANSNNPMNKIKEILASEIIDLQDFVQKVLTIPDARSAFWSKFMMDINSEMDRMCVTSEKSVLREKIVDISPELFVENVFREMDQRCPCVFDILVSLCTPMHIRSTHKNPAVAAMYGIALNARNNQMNLMQKLLSAACIRYGAGNGLFHLLCRMGISLPERSKLPMLSDIGQINGKGVCAALTNGRTIKVTVDNIDGRIKANQVRLGSGNKDYHYTHWTILVDRLLPIDVPELSRQPKVIPSDGLDPNLFFLSAEEHTILKNSYTWLVEKILTEEFPSLSVFKDKIPSVLEHRYRCITDRVSYVHPMFVIMKDPKYLPNCVEIMSIIHDTIKSFYHDAQRDTEFDNSATIPLGGDQLTRVTFDSARSLRAGAHSRSDRLEQFTPVIEELFHVEQDLLEKIVNHFFLSKSSREVGTLANYKAVLHRTNVNGQVKSTNGFEPHKDFVHTIARAMIVELACEKLQIENKTSDIQLPEHIKAWKTSKKIDWLDHFVEPIVDVIMDTYKAPDMSDVGICVMYKGGLYMLKVPASSRGKTTVVNINGDKIRIDVPPEAGSSVQVNDDVYNYSLGFLRASMDLMVLHYVIKAGDIDRLTVLMKRFIPLFIGLTSYKSKYAIECVNFLTKTEHILSEFESVRVKLGAFVNVPGKPGKNKAADMQQENNIKQVKNVIRSLGASKTDKAMERSSKAAPVICELVSDLESSLDISTNSKRNKKSSTEDLSVLFDKMRHLRPFQVQMNRALPAFSGASDNVINNVDKFKLRDFIIRHTKRALNRTVYELNNEEEQDFEA